MNRDIGAAGCDRAALCERLDRIFFPTSLAIVGASDIPGTRGFRLTTTILGGGFKGRVHPVHPSRDTILGLKAYDRVQDIPGRVDLAIIMSPAPLVAAVLRDCIERGITAGILISSGFSEAGGVGARLEAETLAIVRAGRMLVLGPNTCGLVSAPHDLVCLEVPVDPLPGGLAIISQGPQGGAQWMQRCAQCGIGVRFFAATGNGALLSAVELLGYFGARKDVRAVALNLEGGVLDSGLMEAASRVTRRMPVVVLGAGGPRAFTEGHAPSEGGGGTVSPLSDRRPWAGIIPVRTPLELVTMAGAMAQLPLSHSGRVGIMSFGRACGATRTCREMGLNLPDLPPELIRAIEPFMPPGWDRKNPIEMPAEGDVDQALGVMALLAGWDGVDAVIALDMVGSSGLVGRLMALQERFRSCHTRERLRQEKRIFTAIARLQGVSGKPLLAVTPAGEEGRALIDTPEGGVMRLSRLEEACTLIAHMHAHLGYRDGR